jgi:hypothetical protein
MPGLLRTVFGPPRTRGETIVCLGGSALVIALLAAYVDHEGGWHGRSVLQIVVLAAIIFDLIFGMFTSSTTTAKAWYHREGADARRLRLGFVLGHLPYLVAGAALFDTGWTWAIANTGLLLAFAIAVDISPVDLKRIVADRAHAEPDQPDLDAAACLLGVAAGAVIREGPGVLPAAG